MRTISRHFEKSLKHSQEKLQPWRHTIGSLLKQKEDADLRWQWKASSTTCCLSFVPNGHESLLGDKASEDLGLVKRIYQINSENRRNFFCLILGLCSSVVMFSKDTGHYHTPYTSSSRVIPSLQCMPHRECQHYFEPAWKKNYLFIGL